jgi:hypothetical protein
LFKSENLCGIETALLMKAFILILFLKKNKIAVEWIVVFTLLYSGGIFLGNYL